MKHTILFLLVALFLASCASPATPTPTQTFTPAPPTLTPTFTPTFTFTPEPPTFTPTPTLGIGSTEISPKDGMMLLYVPAGNFTMGDKAEDALAECQKYRFDCQLEWFGSEDPLHFGSEQPPHEVYLDAFWIDQTDVTNAMYAKCVADKGACQQPTSLSSATHSSYYSNRQFDDYPVINVNWNMADTYCKWAGRQLPTEAQWEKAASWDADKEQKRVYPWGDSLNCTLANYYDSESNTDCVGDTTKVGSYPLGASFYGALDMAGNVWQWVADWYRVTYYKSSPSSNPLGPDSGQYRVLRGGSWRYSSNSVRSARRGRNDPTDTGNIIGFRCALGAQ